VRSEDQILLALEGLRVSPFHNGENDDKRSYLDIRYAISGNQRTGQSVEERIDEMGANVDRYPKAVASVREDGIPLSIERLFDAAVRAFDNQRYHDRWREMIAEITGMIQERGFDVVLSAEGKPIEIVEGERHESAAS
jgi:hypothetical protein